MSTKSGPDLTEAVEADGTPKDDVYPIAIPHENWISMVASGSWQMGDDLLGSTNAMRAAGESYLPRKEEESVGEYEYRLGGSYLYPGYAEALERIEVKPFAEPPVWTEETPDEIKEEWTLDWDGRGTSFEDYSRHTFRLMIHRGGSFCWSDNRATATEEAERGQKVGNPYGVHLDGWNVINWDHANTESGRALSYLVLLLRQGGVWRLVEYSAKEAAGIQVTAHLWTKPEDGLQETAWTKQPEGQFEFDRIPLRAGYTKRQHGDFYYMPALLSTQWLNRDHWAKSSNFNDWLDVATAPQAWWNVDPKEVKRRTLVMGRRRMLLGGEGKPEYFEPTGNGPAFLERELERIELKMRDSGAQPLREAPVDRTATGRRIDAKEAVTRTQAWTRGLSRLMTEQAQDMAVFDGMAREKAEADIGVAFFDEFGVEGTTDMTLEEAGKARDRGDISRETHWEILGKHRILGDDFDPEVEAARLAAEEPFE